VSCGAAAAGRASAGAGPGRGPQPAVWRGAAVLRRLCPPSPCRGAAPCGLCLVAGEGGWCCCCGAVTHAALNQLGAALIGVRLDVWSLPSRSSSPTVTGCRLGGSSVRRDLWGGERVVGGVLPRISIGTWGLCARLCLVLVCWGRYCLGGGVLLFILGSSLGGVEPVRGVFGGEEEGGGVRSGRGAARTIPLFHTISARPPKQPRMVRTFLKVHTRPRLTYALRCRGY
jgi:hypothetical protein